MLKEPVKRGAVLAAEARTAANAAKKARKAALKAELPETGAPEVKMGI